jgi:ribonuclease E
MRHASSFDPEWGYLAPAPSFGRTARAVIVAAAVGASGGAAAVFSLVDRPAAEESVAARTLAVSSVDAPAFAPTGAVAHLPAQERPPEQRPVAQAPIDRPSAALASVHAAGPATVDSAVVSTTQRPAGVAALAEAPAIVEAPPGKPVIQAATETAAIPAVAAAAAPAAQKKPAKKGHFTVLRNEQLSRGPLALLRMTYPRGAY